MATMIPAYISPDTKSNAEKRIYNLLRDDPGTTGWVVFHSLGLSRHARNRYGEIDFLVIVPGGGIICLEVKGGHVTCHDGIYRHTNRHGDVTETAKSPFEQAREGMFALQKIIRDKATDGNRLAGLCFGFGVMFPDVNWEHKGADYEGWQVYDRSFRSPISTYIGNIVRQNADRKKGFPVPTPEDVRLLRAFLRPDFDYIVSPAQQLSGAEEKLLRLTEEQYHILDALDGNPRQLIEGAAGTGKTFLGIEAARRASLRGERVLMLCYNRLLGQWLESRFEKLKHDENNIVGGSFHYIVEKQLIAKGLQYQEYLAARKAASEAGSLGTFFTEDTTLFALDAITDGACDPFDFLIVDEAQDLMKDEYLMLFDHLLVGGLAGGKWMMLGDFSRQAIYAQAIYADDRADGSDVQDGGSLLRQGLNERASYVSFNLKKNCRNLRKIGDSVTTMSGFESSPFTLVQEEGMVDYRFYDNTTKARKVVSDVLLRLLQDGFKPSEIMILSFTKRENSILKDPLEGMGLPPIHDLTGENLLEESKAIRFSTLHAFKGLECRAAIVIGIEQLNIQDERRNRQLRSQLYVALSRPVSNLTVLLPENARPDYQVLREKQTLRTLTAGIQS